MAESIPFETENLGVTEKTYMNSINMRHSIKRYRTHCCAVAQLGIRDDAPIELIKEYIDEIKKESEIACPQMAWTTGIAETSILVTTLDSETNLIENLKTLGFQVISRVKRRVCYSQDEMITLWLLSW